MLIRQFALLLVMLNGTFQSSMVRPASLNSKLTQSLNKRPVAKHLNNVAPQSHNVRVPPNNALPNSNHNGAKHSMSHVPRRPQAPESSQNDVLNANAAQSSLFFIEPLKELFDPEYKKQKLIDAIQTLLTELEVKNDIEIIYACEYGQFERSLANHQAKHNIQFVYIRNNKASYRSMDYTHQLITGSKNGLIWTGSDLVNEILLKRRRVETPHEAEKLFASTVYRWNRDYAFVDRTRELLMKTPAVSSLVEIYRLAAQSTFSNLMDKNDVYLDFYIGVIRNLAMVEWLNLNFISSSSESERRRPAAAKLVETNFAQVLDDLEDTLGPELHAEISQLASRFRRSNSFDSVKKSEIVDQWIVRTLKDSYDWFLKAEAKENTFPDKSAEFKALLLSDLKTKFDKS